ncbi:MAG TPA: class I SAM-dependent methyltransferase [Acidimicrobiales bacterium]|nr:class I SAM-dependent methyltransferase [Acidimicrobiales bacterium]
MGAGSEWEGEAGNWLRWARTEGHDAYWAYRRPFFETIVPAPGARTVEVGCGEGRVSRDLSARGHRTVGIDLSPTLLRHARDADPDGTYLLADGSALPLADASCDIVVAYNSLMDIADMDAAVAEASRVLVPGGRLCVCVTHPMSNTGRFDTSEADASFVVTETYFGRRRFEGVEARDGLTMTFRGWSYPLEDYARAFERAGLLIELVREPLPDATAPHLLRWRRVPLFLHLRAVRS